MEINENMYNSQIFCINCRGRNTTNPSDCQCFDYFETECSRQCLTMDSGFFKVWLRDIYSEQMDLLLNFTLVRCQGNFLDYLERNISCAINAITNYIYNKYVNISIHHPPTIYTGDIESDSDSSMPSLIDADDNSYSIPSIDDPLENVIYYQEDTANNLFSITRIKRHFLDKFEIICLLEKLQEEENKTMNCCICYEDFKKELFVEMDCKHEFCKDCFIKIANSNRNKKPCCSYCRTEMKTIRTRIYSIWLEIANLTI